MEFENTSIEDLGKRLSSEKRKKKPDTKLIDDIRKYLVKKRQEFYNQLKDFSAVDAVQTDNILKRMQSINRIIGK